MLLHDFYNEDGINVRVHGSYSLSKDTLREEGCPWLIKSPGHYLLVMWHTLTCPLTCGNFWPNTCLTLGGKGPSSSKELGSDTL
jgi:hypothetical protein